MVPFPKKPKPRAEAGFLQKNQNLARTLSCRSSAPRANDKQSAEDLPKPLKRFAFYQRAKTKTSLTGWLPTKNQNLARTLRA